MYNSLKLIPFIFVFLFACGTSAGQGFDDSGVNDNENQTNANENGNNSNPGDCGDGVIDLGEVCDDGENNSDSRPNACRTDCRVPWCGDGIIDTDEECDNTNLAGNSCSSRGYTKGVLGCTATCAFDVSECSLCGDSTAEGTEPTSLGYETCDGSDLRDQTCVSIGQAQGVLLCATDCSWDIAGCVGGGAVCGNGQVETGEDCDDGNQNVTDSCPDGPQGTCLLATCGDGFIQSGVEGCDDGNGLNGDLCPDGVGGTCQLASCGDGHVFIGVELCDTASDPTCYAGCNTRCGDGILQQAPVEEACDDGNNVDDATCYSDCSGFCGDALVHDGVNYPDHGEACDDGANSWTCDSDCTVPLCGDGHCNPISGENLNNCPQDCDCAAMGGSTYSGGCCLPDGLGPPQGCEGTHPGCVVYLGTGSYNCGSCGNHCAPSQTCFAGSCS